MKMIISILPNSFSDQISQALISVGYRVTKFASTAGFLQSGTTTLMTGVAQEQVEDALEIIRGQVPKVEDQILTTIYVINVKRQDRI